MRRGRVNRVLWSMRWVDQRKDMLLPPALQVHAALRIERTRPEQLCTCNQSSWPACDHAATPSVYKCGMRDTRTRTRHQVQMTCYSIVPLSFCHVACVARPLPPTPSPYLAIEASQAKPSEGKASPRTSTQYDMFVHVPSLTHFKATKQGRVHERHSLREGMRVPSHASMPSVCHPMPPWHACATLMACVCYHPMPPSPRAFMHICGHGRRTHLASLVAG